METVQVVSILHVVSVLTSPVRKPAGGRHAGDARRG